MRCKCVGLILTAGLLAGCATTDDPRQGGFFSGIGNLAGGGYERRIVERQETLQQEQQTQQQLAWQADALRQEQAEVNRQLDAANADLARVNASLARIRSQLRSARQQTAAQRAKLQQAEASAREVRTLLQRAKTNVSKNDSKAVASARDQTRDIEQRLGGLNNLVRELGGG
jgi:chromosome segregation ATPase